MKRIAFLSLIVLIFSTYSHADEYPEMKQLKELHAEICREHSKPDLCLRAVGYLMKGVQTEGDIYSQCQELTEAQRDNEEACRAAIAVRQLINGFK
ncbi:hypothetical protein [Entomohabitans teleogrylli]|uniref:hypothetical protein n=1 Tax=Entomohabitans teleogrylli TaxID=1384589 RepID=UPI00073D51DD|nr:hypothetical protein [Entomohabitans teleogrylli]